ncbi:MAG: hypothetical protein P8K79_01600 [Mariniblastus sp.]|nr:hypothetical protein [Mariniblastus sp.]
MIHPQLYRCSIAAARAMAVVVLLIGFFNAGSLLAMGFLHYLLDSSLADGAAMIAFYGYGAFVWVPLLRRGRNGFLIGVLAGTLLGLGSLWIMLQSVVVLATVDNVLNSLLCYLLAGLVLAPYYLYLPCQIVLRRQQALKKGER